MTVEGGASGFFERLNRTLSPARFGSYKKQTGHDHDALCKYVWNTLICEALYPSFQILEVGFRNALHSEIAKRSGDQTWLMNGGVFLYEDERDVIAKSRSSALSRIPALSEDILVAEMNFGFWTTLLDARYDTIWHKIIKEVFPNMPRSSRTRKEASKSMNTVRRLRNAALHHHSIWHWSDLQRQHGEMHELIYWICASASKLAKEIDRFPLVYSQGHGHYSELCRRISN